MGCDGSAPFQAVVHYIGTCIYRLGHLYADYGSWHGRNDPANYPHPACHRGTGGIYDPIDHFHKNPLEWELDLVVKAGDRIGLFGRDMAALVI
jgi:hypothetical protein